MFLTKKIKILQPRQGTYEKTINTDGSSTALTKRWYKWMYT